MTPRLFLTLVFSVLLHFLNLLPFLLTCFPLLPQIWSFMKLNLLSPCLVQFCIAPFRCFVLRVLIDLFLRMHVFMYILFECFFLYLGCLSIFVCSYVVCTFFCLVKENLFSFLTPISCLVWIEFLLFVFLSEFVYLSNKFFSRVKM